MKSFALLILSLAAALMTGCSGSAERHLSDFTSTVYAPTYASGFDIRGTERDASTLISVHNPWQGDARSEQHLILLRGKAKAPADGSVQAVRAPVQRVVCMSSSHVALFDALELADRIVGVSGLDYISNPRIQQRSHSGELRDVGYDTNLNFELLTALHPDVILLYGISGENTTITDKLRELGIPYLYVGDYVEESPLGKAEWLVAAAEMCDLRAAGADTLRRIAARYNDLRARLDPADARPKVMLNTPYRDTWFMPSTQSYMVRLIEDAGGSYIYTKNHTNASVAVDLEEAYLLANSADFWINVGACNSIEELTAQNPKFAEVPAVVDRCVWNNNRRQTPSGGSDFWESGVVRPDVVLRDLKTILAGGSDSTYYYKRLE